MSEQSKIILPWDRDITEKPVIRARKGTKSRWLKDHALCQLDRWKHTNQIGQKFRLFHCARHKDTFVEKEHSLILTP